MSSNESAPIDFTSAKYDDLEDRPLTVIDRITVHTRDVRGFVVAKDIDVVMGRDMKDTHA